MAYIGTKPADKPLTAADIADGIITTAKIADGNITSTKILDGTILNADINASAAIVSTKLSGIATTNGITQADQWRISANITASVDPIANNLERSDSTGFGYIGTGMSVSSGIWTFPSTGYYFVQYTLLGSGTNDTIGGEIKVTTNNSTYTVVAQGTVGDSAENTNTATTSTYVDVTDTANVKVRFTVNSISAGNSVIEGSSSQNLTHFTFIRLGDT
jgi:hypothetical protein